MIGFFMLWAGAYVVVFGFGVMLFGPPALLTVGGFLIHKARGGDYSFADFWGRYSNDVLGYTVFLIFFVLPMVPAFLTIFD